MADSPTDSATPNTVAAPVSPAPAAPSAAPRRWRVLPFMVGLLVLGAVGTLAWWAIAGSKFWTDGASLHVNDNDARIREVVWTPPIPLTVFNTSQQEYEPSVSPDGDELYFVRGKAGQNPGAGHNADIYVSYRRMGAWTPPVPVDAVNTDFDELGPRVTADGKFLLFYSNRPGGLGGYDIWAAPRLPADGARLGEWGKPFNLGPGVNTEFDEYNPDPSPDGQRLFFATNRKAASREQKQAWRATIRAGTNADFDLWYAMRDAASDAPIAIPTTNPSTRPAAEGSAETPPSDSNVADAKRQAALPFVFKGAAEVPGINTPYAEGASCMSPAGDFLYFASDRPGGFGKFDIYRARALVDGTFGPVENLGPAINTSDNETDPQLALNGFRLYFSSDRHAGDAAAGAPLTAKGPAADGGGYNLLQSDSREVYSVRAGHRLPHLSWSWLVLGLSLLALIPLVMFMRKWDDQRLNLLQKCLLVSLLVHVLITLGLSMKKVTTDVYHYVRQEQGLEPPIDLTLTLNGPAGRADDVGAAIREQSSTDIPTTPAPPTAMAPQPASGADLPDAPAMPAVAQTAVPRAGIGASETMVHVAGPKIPAPDLAPLAQAPPVVPTVTPQTPLVDVQIAVGPHVSQAEAAPPVAPAMASPAARVDVGVEPKIDAPQLSGSEKSVPAAAQTVSLVDAAATPRPATPDVTAITNPSKLVQAQVAAPSGVANLAAPKIAVGKAQGIDAKPIAGALPDVARQAVAPNVAGEAPFGSAAANAASKVPAVQTAAESLAANGVAHALPLPGESVPVSSSRTVQPNPGVADAVNDLTAPKMAAAKASAIESAQNVEVKSSDARQVTASPAADSAVAPAADVIAGTSKIAPAQAKSDSVASEAVPHALQQAALATGAAAAPGPAVPPNAELSIHPSSQLPGPAAGPLASNRPDVPEGGEMLAGASRAGDAAGPGGPAMLPQLTVPSSPAAAGVGAAQSVVNAPTPVASAAAGTTVSTAVTVETVKPAAGPLVDAQPIKGATKAAVSGQADIPVGSEIAVANSRSSAATTRPVIADANPTGLARTKLPSVEQTPESLASVPDGRPAAVSSAGPSASVTPTTSADVSAGPPIGEKPIADARKAAVSGQPDAPAATEVSRTFARNEPSGATTQPTVAGAIGVSSGTLPNVSQPGESIVSAPDARAMPGAASTAVKAAPVAPATSAAMPAGPAVGARPLTDIAKASASNKPDAPVASELADSPVRNASPAKTDHTTAPGDSLARLNLPARPTGSDTATSGVSGAVAPTTRPLDTSTAVAFAAGPKAQGRGMSDFAAQPQVGAPKTGVSPIAALIEASESARIPEVDAGPRKADRGPIPGISAGTSIDHATAPVPAAGAAIKEGVASQSLASAAGTSPREIVASPIGPRAGPGLVKAPPTPAVTVTGPSMSLPKAIAAQIGPARTGPANAAAPDAAAIAVSRAASTVAPGDGRPASGNVLLASANIPGISVSLPATGADPARKALDSTASRTMTRTVSGPPVVAPEVTVAVPKIGAPESLFQRSAEQRKPLVEKRGGTPESEGAVERALAYLAREQEPDGRWTVFNDDGPPGKRGHHPHDMACTGLATLAFLTADHTPTRQGPYRDSVARSVDFLISQQGEDGDMRGPRRFRGGGADQGNMYDHGICTMALCEAALMTGDRRYTAAALRAAQFIVAAQNPKGGWRYTPAEAGDTSVLGWQMLALHDAQQLGFQVPQQTHDRAERFIKSVSYGNTKILASYMPGEGATSAMTAEALFSRLLLGDEITAPETKEVCQFLTRDLPQPGGADFYFWYYASLSLSQMPDLIKSGPNDKLRAGPQAGGPEATIAADAWKKWNSQTRDTLIKMQRKQGPADGCWADARWSDRGGRVFTTALATLTLEVYYRYLPLRASTEDDSNDAANDPRRASAEIKANRAPTPGGNPAKPRGKGWNDTGGHYPGVEPN